MRVAGERHATRHREAGGWRTFSCRQGVTVTNSGDVLQDYAVRIDVTESSHLNGFWDKARPDGVDIVFFGTNGNQLGHWKEYFDPAKKIGIFHVNTPQLPNGFTAINMQWGNNSGTADSGFENIPFAIPTDGSSV